MAGTSTGSSSYVHVIAEAASKDVFVDQFGNTHELQPDHRSLIKPGWQNLLSRESVRSPSNEALQRLQEMAWRVRLAVSILGTMGCELRSKRILNVGCDDAAETLLLGCSGVSEVVGTNYSGVLLDRSDSAGERFRVRRDHVGRAFRDNYQEFSDLATQQTSRITFVGDDISASLLEGESFDVLCSWQTLEHLTAPANAFSEMYRLLRPGAYAYHEYNPFFCIEGGHSLCTLDFPWGHVRLSSDDFERYLEEYRPDELEVARDYFHNGLNRTSLDEMQICCREAGFEILCFVPRARTEDLMALSKPMYDQARRLYPHIPLNDLICRMVRLVLRKPGA